MILWCIVLSPAYTPCNNNATVTSEQRCDDVWRNYDVTTTSFICWDIDNVLHVAPYTHNSNMPFCINDNHLNKSNLTFAHGKYIGLLAIIMLLHNALPQLMVWYRRMLYHLLINYFGIPFKCDQAVISIRLLQGLIISFQRQLPHY